MSTLPDPVTLPDMAGDESEPGADKDRIASEFLLEESPITPLGQATTGSRIVFLDANNALQERDTRLSGNDFVLHCGGEDWLWDNYPRYQAQSEKEKTAGAPRVQVGFDHGKAGHALAAACFTKGIFNPEGRVFGRGAHRPRHDEDMLLLHCGNRLLLANAPDKRGRRLKTLQSVRAGEYMQCYYPGGQQLPLPDLAKGAEPAEVRELMDLFGEWNWVMPEVAKLLVLGWIGQMYVCGALGWRAHIWLTGSTAAGKSHLQKLMRALAGDWAITTEDASAAYIRNKLGLDRLAVLIDEAEADDDADRQQAMLTLARKGSSGGSIGRSTSDQKANESTIHSAFVLSSIIHSIKVGQDHNRFAILDMKPIDSKKPDLKLDLPRYRALGRRLHRRMLDHWSRFEGTLDTYKGLIHAAGYAGRWRDTFGTLLACADMLLFEDSPRDRFDPLTLVDPDPDSGGEAWVRLVEPLMMRGTEEARTDTQRCVQYLLSALIPGANGNPAETVARWLHRAVEPTTRDEHGASVFCVNESARDRLKTYGLRVFLPRQLSVDGKGRANWGTEELGTGEAAWRDGYLAVAGGGHRGLGELFRHAPSDFTSGQWVQSLQKADDAIRLRMRFEKVGSPEYVVALPLRMFGGGG